MFVRVDRAFVAALGVVLVIVIVHVIVTVRSGFALSDETRDRFGASAATTFSRAWAHFTAPFFHYGWGHIAYNSAILLATMPFALRAFGVGRGLTLAYLASPLSGMLVNVLLILPLAAMGVGYAANAAPARLVGSSVMVFAGAGLALSAFLAGRDLGIVWSAVGVAAFLAYELSLARFGATQSWVWAYHTTGFLVGSIMGRVLLR